LFLIVVFDVVLCNVGFFTHKNNDMTRRGQFATTKMKSPWMFQRCYKFGGIVLWMGMTKILFDIHGDLIYFGQSRTYEEKLDFTNPMRQCLDEVELSNDDNILCQEPVLKNTIRMKNSQPLRHIGAREVTTASQSIRIVLFLCDSNFWLGAVAILQSLKETSISAPFPPLILIVGRKSIGKRQIAVLRHLGAEVKILRIPRALYQAAKNVSTLGDRWQGVFSKFLIFRPDIVRCDIVFYIDLDVIVRGNIIDCMHDLLDTFRNNELLYFMAAGSLEYFNNGVMLVRPRKKVYSYMIEMLRNGTCMGRICNNTTTKMNRIIYTDQDVFISFAQRFPERFGAISEKSAFNIQPTYNPVDRDQNCSIVHYTGYIKPWSSLFPNISIDEIIENLPVITRKIPNRKGIIKFNSRTRPIEKWALELWRDNWNKAVKRLRAKHTRDTIFYSR
jgi:lipopolysaccharide biosynthesis glycosyltransferase